MNVWNTLAKTFFMKNVYLTVTLLLSIILCNVFDSEAQSLAPKYRPNLQTVNNADLNFMSDVLKDYITPARLNQYYANPTGGFTIQSGGVLPFKQRIALLHAFEDYLTLNQYNTPSVNYVPFPAWNTADPIVAQFYGTDQDCTPQPSTNCPIPNNYSSLALTQPTLPHVLFPAMCNYNQQSFIDYMTAGAPMFLGFASKTSLDMGLQAIGSGQHIMPFPVLASMPFNSYFEDKWREYNCECTQQNPNPKQIDLYLKDRPSPYDEFPDIGTEPNLSPITWESGDIWVRNDNNGFNTDISQNPQYTAGVTRKVYVRVRNRGCQNSKGTETLTLYWSKAGTYHNWPAPWNGAPIGGQVLGGLINTQIIPVVPHGDQVILEFDWQIPNPSFFGAGDVDLNNDGIPDGWHFCLLARISSAEDLDGVQLVGNNMTNILKGSNNFAMRNTTVVDFSIQLHSGVNHNGTIMVGNLTNQPDEFDILFDCPLTYTEPEPITEVAEVIVSLSQSIWDKWMAADFQSDNIEIYSDENRQIKLLSPSASIKHLYFDTSEVSKLNVTFHFLTQHVQNNMNYLFHVSQKNANSYELIGGETYEIERKIRPLFSASTSGDIVINEFETITIAADNIGESAIYRWLEDDGSVAYVGQNLTISPEFSKNYLLEVTALEDGYRDYHHVYITVRNNYIVSLSPNPASNNINVNYKIHQSANTAKLIVSNLFGFSEEVLLNKNASNSNIGTYNYNNGIYNVQLVVDDIIVDNKNLLIQH
jgi:hypothetical protein